MSADAWASRKNIASTFDPRSYCYTTSMTEICTIKVALSASIKKKFAHSVLYEDVRCSMSNIYNIFNNN